MSAEDADELEAIFEKQSSLTSDHELWVQRQVSKFAAIRESDRLALQSLVDWDDDRDYIVDPLGERVADAFSDFLFSEDPIFTAAQTAADALGPGTKEADTTKEEEDETSEERDAESGVRKADLLSEPNVDDAGDDQQRLEDLIEENNLPTELREACKVHSSEGEVWYRIYKDEGQSNYPVLEWHSRSHVRPLFRGKKLRAAAFISEIFDESAMQGTMTVWRYCEIQTDGYTRNVLYKGDINRLGQKMDLNDRPETAGLQPEWTHDLGMLAGRIVNKIGRDRRYGISDFNGVLDLLLSLNEAASIGHENLRLVAKKRVAVPREALDENQQLNLSEDVIVMDSPLDESMDGKTAQGQFTVLEYSFDAHSLIMYQTNMSNLVLTRVGLAKDITDPNSGRSGGGGGGGGSASGSALRVRLIPTIMTAKGKARAWDDELPTVLMKLQQVDALPEARGGFGRSWKMPGEPPAIERSDPLPADETEEVNRHVAAVGAEFESRYSAIKSLHPEWDDNQITEELDRIKKELDEFGAPKGAKLPNLPPPPGAPVAPGLPNAAGEPVGPGGMAGNAG